MKYKLITYEFECEYCGLKEQATFREDKTCSFDVPSGWRTETSVRTEAGSSCSHVCMTCHARRNPK